MRLLNTGSVIGNESTSASVSKKATKPVMVSTSAKLQAQLADGKKPGVVQQSSAVSQVQQKQTKLLTGKISSALGSRRVVESAMIAPKETKFNNPAVNVLAVDSSDETIGRSLPTSRRIVLKPGSTVPSEVGVSRCLVLINFIFK